MGASTHREAKGHQALSDLPETEKASTVANAYDDSGELTENMNRQSKGSSLSKISSTASEGEIQAPQSTRKKRAEEDSDKEEMDSNTFDAILSPVKVLSSVTSSRPKRMKVRSPSKTSKSEPATPLSDQTAMADVSSDAGKGTLFAEFDSGNPISISGDLDELTSNTKLLQSATVSRPRPNRSRSSTQNVIRELAKREEIKTTELNLASDNEEDLDEITEMAKSSSNYAADEKENANASPLNLSGGFKLPGVDTLASRIRSKSFSKNNSKDLENDSTEAENAIDLTNSMASVKELFNLKSIAREDKHVPSVTVVSKDLESEKIPEAQATPNSEIKNNIPKNILKPVIKKPEIEKESTEAIPEFLRARNKLKSVSAHPKVAKDISEGKADSLAVNSRINSEFKDHSSKGSNDRLNEIIEGLKPVNSKENVKSKSKESLKSSRELLNAKNNLKSTPSSEYLFSTSRASRSASSLERSKNSLQSLNTKSDEPVDEEISPVAHVPSNNSLKNNTNETSNTKKLDDSTITKEETNEKPLFKLRSVGTRDPASLMDAMLLRESMLLLVKGRKKLIISVIKLSIESLNKQDAFILDCINPMKNKEKELRKLFVVYGGRTSVIRRTRVLELATKMKEQDYAGKADIIQISLKNDSDKVFKEEDKLFWNTLTQSNSVTKKDVSTLIDGIREDASTGDDEYESMMHSRTKLYLFENKTSNPEILVENGKGLSQDLLNSDICAVLVADNELYIWMGRKTDHEYQNHVKNFGASKLEEKKLVLFHENEKYESTIFRSKFPSWKAADKISTIGVMKIGNIKPKDSQYKVYGRGSDIGKIKKLDIAEMHSTDDANITAKNTEAQEVELSELLNRDWGYVNLRIWEIDARNVENSKIVDVSIDSLNEMQINFNENSPFVFFSDKCYIILYEYKERPNSFADKVLVERSKSLINDDFVESMNTRAILYSWSGGEVNASGKAYMANIVVEMTNLAKKGELKVDGKIRHINSAESKEPLHLLRILKGVNLPPEQPQKILDIVQRAEDPACSVVLVRRNSDFNNYGEKSLFKVFGSSEETVRAFEMPHVSSEFLSTCGCFVLFEGTKSNTIYSWVGKNSLPWEKNTATELTNQILRSVKPGGNIVEIFEGQEFEEFWKALGGKKAYDQHSHDYKNRNSLNYYKPGSNNVVPSSSSTNSASKGETYAIRLWKINYFVNENPTAREIFSFNHSDLKEDAVFILDSYFKIYIWIGSLVARGEGTIVRASEEGSEARNSVAKLKDILLAFDTAERYVNYVSDLGRKCLDLSKIFVLQSGKESKDFMAQFPYWIHRDVPESSWPSGMTLPEAQKFIDNQKFTLSEVQKFAESRSDLPFGFDLERIENHIFDSDFERAFGVDRKKFSSMAKWRQNDLKKKVGLF